MYNRLCKLCNIKVEDKIHFLLECPKLNSKRSTTLSDTCIYLKYKNISTLSLLKPNQVFIWLMSSEDPYVIQSISKLFLILFSERNEIHEWHAIAILVAGLGHLTS